MRRAIVLIITLSIAGSFWGCAEGTPEEQVAEARARYTVTLNGFFVKEEPAEEPMEEMMGDEASEAAEAVASAVAEEVAEEGEETAEGMMEEEVGPQTVDVLLDLIVQHDLDEALPGITVDLVMVDPERNEKGSWKVWIDTEGLPEANQKQVTHVLEGVAYEEGDAFSVEVRSPVPAEEYGDYREFAEAGP